MIHLIVTGHGEFSQGLHHALVMIAGRQSHVTQLNFNDGMALEEYSNQLNDSMSKGLENSDGVVIMTDLKGGTPFNTAMILTEEEPQVEVIYGTNLPMLIEGALMATMESNPRELAESLTNKISEYVGVGVLDTHETDDEIELDGI